MQGINIDLTNSCYFGSNAVQCLLDQTVNAFGGKPLFGLLAGALIFVVFYIASNGSLATPTTALILTGTVFVPMLPPNYQTIAYSVVLLGLAAALWSVFQQYVLSGGAVR